MVFSLWVVAKIRVPFWVPIIIRHLVFRVPKRDPNFDSHSYRAHTPCIVGQCIRAHQASKLRPTYIQCIEEI